MIHLNKIMGEYMLTILVIIFYLLSFILTYGSIFAMVQRGAPYVAKYDYESDIICSIIFGIFSPIILPLMFIISAVSRKWIFKYGLKFW